MLTEAQCKPIDILWILTQKLLLDQRDPLSNPKRYRRLVDKLCYLTVTQLDIAYQLSGVSQFKSTLRVPH